jgi:hypothetical protein
MEYIPFVSLQKGMLCSSGGIIPQELQLVKLPQKISNMATKKAPRRDSARGCIST